MSINKDIAKWLLEAASMAFDLSMVNATEDAQIWHDRAAQIEQMQCKTCRYYSEYIAKDRNNQPGPFNMCLEGYVRNQGPDFGCWQWESKGGK